MAIHGIPDARRPRDSVHSPSAVDPGLALIRAVPPNAATLVHNAIMDMLRVPPLPRQPPIPPAE